MADDPGGLATSPPTYVQWRKLCQQEFSLHATSWTTAMQSRHFTVDEAMSAHKRNMKPKEFVSTVVSRWHAARTKVAK